MTSSPRVVTMMMGSVAKLVLPAHELHDLEPADVRHVEVENDDVRIVCSESCSIASSPLDAWVTCSDGSGRRHAVIMSRMTLLSSTTSTFMTCLDATAHAPMVGDFVAQAQVNAARRRGSSL